MVHSSSLLSGVCFLNQLNFLDTHAVTLSLTVPSPAFWLVCELGFLRAGIYNYAGLCLEPQEPLCPHELLWAAHLPGPVSTVGSHGLFSLTGKLHYCGPFG